MSDLTEFLLARIAEDKETARFSESLYGAGSSLYVAGHDPARVLDECAAKWLLVEDHAEYAEDMATAPSDFAAGRLFMARLALARLAAVYSDHSDYRQEWAP